MQGPDVATAPDAVALAPATKLTDGVGLPLHGLSFKITVTGFNVAEGLAATPTVEAGTAALPRVNCATESAPLVLIAALAAARYRLPSPSAASVFAPAVETM